jgi:alkylated DNA repair dioxygenase AlkB
MRSQLSLFDAPVSLPEGFLQAAELISSDQESCLIDVMRELPFKEFEFQGFLGKRRVVSFGWKYDFNTRALRRSEEIPEFLLPVRERAACFAGVPASSLQQVLVTEYRPGASIGWHRDKAVFGEVIGISLLSSCRLRLRRKSGAAWRRASLTLALRSAYLLKGPARSEWEHSIPPVAGLRYSITLRNFKAE